MAGLKRGQRVAFVEGVPPYWNGLVGQIPKRGIEVACQRTVDEVELKIKPGQVVKIPTQFVKLVGGRPKRLFED